MKRQFRREYGARNRAKTTSKAEIWARFEIRKINRQDYQKFMKAIIAENATSNPWRFVKSKGCDTAGISLLRRNGLIFSESRAMADQFCNVFTREGLDDLPTLEESTHPDMPQTTVSERSVYKLLPNLNPMKAAIPDGAPVASSKRSTRKLHQA